jgi:uncharacterized protein YndB with AHSA1/START domain
MKTPGGSVHWARWEFREIVPHERLVFVACFSDEEGNVARAPWEENWPLEMLSVVTFAEHAGKGGGTVVSVRWTPINASPREVRAFDEGRSGMSEGWTGTMARLEAYVGEAR